MSILKVGRRNRAKTQEAFGRIDRDLLDVFHLNIEGLSTPSEGFSTPTNKDSLPLIKCLIAASVVAVFALLAAFVTINHATVPKSPDPYAYFEVKAVSSRGRPVVGATVILGGKNQGVTDSFGEWRRFKRVSLGGQIRMRIEKSSRKGLLVGEKAIQVPAKLKTHGRGEIEIKQAIEVVLAPFQESLSPNQKVAAGGQQSIPNLNSRHAPVTVKPNTAIDQLGASLWIVAAPFAGALALSKGDQKRLSFLKRQVVKRLRQHARESGFRLTPESRNQILLHYLKSPQERTKSGRGLIMVKVSGQDGEITILRNFAKTGKATAQNILWALSKAVATRLTATRDPVDGSWQVARRPTLFALKGGTTVFDREENPYVLIADQGRLRLAHAKIYPPCGGQSPCLLRTMPLIRTAPAPAWKKLSLKLLTPLSNEKKIFVSGFPALPLGENLWQYWGQHKGLANLTIVERGQIIYRQKILGDQGKPHLLTLPAFVISRR